MLNKLKISLYSFFGTCLFNLCFGTSRWKIIGYSNLANAFKKNKPILLCVWHGRSIFASYYLSSLNYKKYAVVGLHNDAEIISKILLKWNFGLIRGSSSRGGKNVINLLNKKLVSGNIVCITNDGPRGPKHIAKKGSLSVALKQNAIIIPITGIATNFWKFNSWDDFLLPKPFSKIFFSFGSPINCEKETTETLSTIVSDKMNELQRWGDSLI